MSQFAMCFLSAQVRMWNMTFPTLCLTRECWMGLREQLTVGCFPELCGFLVFRGAGACRVAEVICQQFRFSSFLLCRWFYYY